MQDAQVSCIIHGTDDWRWVGYGFVDSEVDGDLNDAPESLIDPDQIAGKKSEAKFPVWQPRRYWIKIFELRIASIGKQWEYNLYKLQCAIGAYLTKDPKWPCLSKKAAQEPKEVRQAFDWALQAVGILRHLTDILSKTLDAWAKFNYSDGDIKYFEGIDDNELPLRDILSLHTIKQVFWKLEGVYKNFLALSKRCSDYMSALKLRLFLQSKEAADGNGFTSTLTIMFPHPVALAACIFSMQPEAIPFKPMPRSFAAIICVLVSVVITTIIISRELVPKWRLISMMPVHGLNALLSRKKGELEILDEKLASPENKIRPSYLLD